MRVRYMGDDCRTVLDKGCAYELADVTDEGYFKVWSEAIEGWLLLPPSDFELAERPLSRSPHYAQEGVEWTTFYSSCFCCVLEVGKSRRLRLTERFYSSLAADGF